MATAGLDSLDLGVLSVVASFGYPAELVGLGLALGKERVAELMSLTATVDAVLMQTRCCVEVKLHFRAKKRWSENGFPRCGGCPAEGLNLIQVTNFGCTSRPGNTGSCTGLGRLLRCKAAIAEEERPVAVQELVARLVDGLYHHGAASVVASTATGDYYGEGAWPSPAEKVHIVSLRGASGGRVPFIMSHGSVEFAQIAEGSIHHVSLFVRVGPTCERMFTFCFATGDAGPSHSRYVSASRETCARVAAALGVEANEIGYALRTVVMAVNMKIANDESVWLALEVLAHNDNGSPYFWDIFYDGTGLTEEEEVAAYLFNGPACTTFPFECQLARPHFMVENPGEGDGIGMWRRVSESPRKLLFDVQALLESRLQDPTRTSSLGSTIKALDEWQLALDKLRWDRAVAAAVAERAAEQPGMSDEEWANFSFGEGRVKESNCFPFEYKGPAFASRCKCCCPSFRNVQVATKPDDVSDYAWYHRGHY